ncbi:MAB_1171c family putative transporter [Streptomyces sp. NPDC087917]|uniref:MAB_1171c family putative transporter n=1 Tax=Streptomyces sp. NPDC087917 TaxID=3155060 RepID=UPI00343CFE6B
MSSASYYGLAALLLAAFVARLPGLVRHRRDPLVRSVSLLLPLAAAVFFFSAPPTIARVNEGTGIPNASAPFVYAMVTALSAALIHLTITWRGGPDDRRRRATRWCLGVYGSVIAAVLTLFALGDAPEERLRDFDTHYANAPYLGAMIVLYILGHALASVVLAVLCLRWSREVTGVLRTGLLLIVLGSALSLVHTVCKFVAIGARWSGHDLDGFGTVVAPAVVSVASLCHGLGFVLPSMTQTLTGQWRRWSRYRRLRPLWLVVRAATPYEPIRIPWWSSLGKRHLRRTCDIRDGLRLFSPYLTPDTAGPPPTGGALRPESARYVSMVADAFAGARPGRAGHDGASVVNLLEGDEEELLCLSDALRALAAPPVRPPRVDAGRAR